MSKLGFRHVDLVAVSHTGLCCILFGTRRVFFNIPSLLPQLVSHSQAWSQSLGKFVFHTVIEFVTKACLRDQATDDKNSNEGGPEEDPRRGAWSPASRKLVETETCVRGAIWLRILDPHHQQTVLTPVRSYDITTLARWQAASLALSSHSAVPYACKESLLDFLVVSLG